MLTKRVRLTMQRIAEATCPADKSHVLLWDSERPGLAARIYPSGRKQFVLLYRAGGGRQGKLRWLTLGEVAALGLAEARTAAGVHLGAVARGEDPAERKREVRRRERAIVSAALDRYGQEIEGRKLAKAGQIMSTLRRGLAADLRRDLAELDRATLVERIEAVARNYGAGAGAYFRARLSTFCSWAAEKGLVTANPLAGWRRQRRSRAERLDRTGRALEDWELRAAWSAFDASDDPVFAAYLRTLLLAGQRRTETALMRWSDLEVNAGVWTIPAEVTKSGRAHRVPVAPELARILRTCPDLPVTISYSRAEEVCPSRASASGSRPCTTQAPPLGLLAGRCTICAGPCALALAGSASTRRCPNCSSTTRSATSSPPPTTAATTGASGSRLPAAGPGMCWRSSRGNRKGSSPCRAGRPAEHPRRAVPGNERDRPPSTRPAPGHPAVAAAGRLPPM